MLNRTGSMLCALSLITLSAACGSSPDTPSDASTMAGAAGAPGAAGSNNSAGSNNAAGSSTAGNATGGASSPGGSGGASTAGKTSSGAGGSATGGHGGTGGTGGSGGTGLPSGGNANGGGPASTEGLAFSGSCLNTDHCTDEWDVTFGAAALEQICTSQQGTWSTGHCSPTAWKKKCTQAVLGGVYVQYLPADGICAAGFEEQL